MRIQIDSEATPVRPGRNIPLNWWMEWPKGPEDLDDLVRFIYANQGNLFVEDAVLFRHSLDGSLRIRRDDIYERVRGSWEQTEAIFYNLDPMMVDTIVESLQEQEDGQRDDLVVNTTRANRIRVLRALGRQ